MINQFLKPYKNKILESQNQYSISYNNFRSFLDKSFIDPLTAEIARDYAEYTQQLAKMMHHTP